MTIYHPSIRLKIFVIILLMVIVPLSIVTSLFFLRSEEALILQNNKIIGNRLEKTIGKVDADLLAGESMLDLIVVDAELIKASRVENTLTKKERIGKYKVIRDLFTFFTRRLAIFNILSGDNAFYYYLPYQKTLIDSKTTYYEAIDSKKIDFINKAKNPEKQGRWTAETPVDFYTLTGESSDGFNEKVMTYTKNIIDISGGVTGILALNVDLDYFRELYEEVSYDDHGIFILLDEEQNVITMSNHMRLFRGEETEISGDFFVRSEKFNDHKEDYYILKSEIGDVFVTYKQSKYTGWYYLYIVSSESVVGKISELKEFLQYMILIVLIVIVWITYMLSRLFYQPLQKLLVGMRAVGSGSLKVQIEDHRNDEIQLIYTGFNTMVNELSSLVKDLYREKILTKDAEIQLLQAQINPHFLYNTLDSIYNIALIEDVEIISTLVESMSRFFRISLSGGRNVVSLNEAISLTEHYMIIQNIRFENRIDYNVDIDKKYMSCKVPKFILQPIVENAVIHGLEDNNHEGSINVTVTSKENDLIIKVMDDGVGMSEEKLLEVTTAIFGNKKGGRYFALRNIHKQLEMQYGPGYGVQINTVAYEGTEVILRLAMDMHGGELLD